MNSSRGYQITIAVFIIIILIMWGSLDSMNNKLADTELSLDQYKSAIDDANSHIEDAHDNAWSDYDTMGTTLETLETVDPETY